MKPQPMQIVRIVLGIIWRIILIVIALFILAYILLMGGCAALSVVVGVSENVQDGLADAAVQQARRAPLPSYVQRLVNAEYLGGIFERDPRLGEILVSDTLLPPQNLSGRYMLTNEGLFDFATASLTPLDCPSLRPVTDADGFINFRKRWLDDRLFMWGRCVFDLETLQAGAIEDLWCGAGRSSCSHAELQDALTAIIPKTDQAYVNHDQSLDEYLLIDLSSDGRPVHLWTEHSLSSRDVTALLFEQAGLMAIPAPSQDGRAIPPGTHRLSPNGEYDASVAYDTLVIQRAQDGSFVIEARAEDFHQTFANEFPQEMYGLGWTDDSRQIIFLVRASFNGRRSLAQIFVLTIP